MVVERLQWDFRKRGAEVYKEFSDFESYLISEFEIARQLRLAGGEPHVHTAYPSAPTQCLSFVEPIRETIDKQADKLQGMTDFGQWAPTYLCDGLQKELLSMVYSISPTLAAT